MEKENPQREKKGYNVCTCLLQHRANEKTWLPLMFLLFSIPTDLPSVAVKSRTQLVWPLAGLHHNQGEVGTLEMVFRGSFKPMPIKTLKSIWEKRNPIKEHHFWSFQNVTPCKLTQVPKSQLPSSLVSYWSCCYAQSCGHTESLLCL